YLRQGPRARVREALAMGWPPRRILTSTDTAHGHWPRGAAMRWRKAPASPLPGTSLSDQLSPRGSRWVSSHFRAPPGPGTRLYDPRTSMDMRSVPLAFETTPATSTPANVAGPFPHGPGLWASYLTSPAGVIAWMSPMLTPVAPGRPASGA